MVVVISFTVQISIDENQATAEKQFITASQNTRTATFFVRLVEFK